MENQVPTTQPITGPNRSEAEKALGGPATRPPGPPPPQAPPLENPSLAARREAFREANLAPVPQPIRVAQVAKQELPPLGHPTFDAPTEEVKARRAKVELVRERLGNLARSIRESHETLQPMIAELDAVAAAVKAAEGFDPTAARNFLADLSNVVDALAAKPTQPKKSDA